VPGKEGPRQMQASLYCNAAVTGAVLRDPIKMLPVPTVI
jgi:hypothetical protein